MGDDWEIYEMYLDNGVKVGAALKSDIFATRMKGFSGPTTKTLTWKFVDSILSTTIGSLFTGSRYIMRLDYKPCGFS